jgi:hypothetical protein
MHIQSLKQLNIRSINSASGWRQSQPEAAFMRREKSSIIPKVNTQTDRFLG